MTRFSSSVFHTAANQFGRPASSFNPFNLLPAGLLTLLCFATALRADTFFTQVSQGGSQSWTNAIWTNATHLTPLVAVAGNSYVTLANGIAVGTNLNETRLRNPAFSGVWTFPGDVLTLSTNTEIRMKQVGATLNFQGVGGNPGLILNGGVLNVGDSGAFTVSGSVQASAGSVSYFCPGNNDAVSVDNNRVINFAAQLSGSGTLVLFEAGNQPQQISCSSNTFSGQWIVKCGYLQGAGAGSLGTNSIVVDPKYPLRSPPFDSTITNAANGPAMLEVNYDLTGAGALILTNGGTMKLHQNCVFGAVIVEGTTLSAGTHSYAELAGTFPANFAAGGSGSLTVQSCSSGPAPPVINSQPLSQTLASGQIAQFTMGLDACSARPLAYQWQSGARGSGVYTNLSDGGQFSGSTNATLTLSNVVPANTADFIVFVTNSYGAVTSMVATLTVTQAPPAILTQPLSQALYSGQTAHFNVSVSGSPPLSYQWIAAPTGSSAYTNLADNSQISGSFTTNLVIDNVSAANTADYRVVITNSAGSVTSASATLTVLPAPPTALESTALRVAINPNPFSFQVIEKATGLVLLLQTANQFTFNGTAYTVASASNLVATANTLDADLFFSGTSSSAHLQFSFSQPEILQVSITSGSNATQVLQQFADQGENIYGVWEYPLTGTINMRGTANKSFPGGGSGGPANTINGTSGHAPFYLTSRRYGIYAQSDVTGQFTLASNGQTSFSFNVPQLTFQVIYGPDYASILNRYDALAGGSFMPPTWAFDSIWWKDDDHSDFHGSVVNAQGNVLDTAIQLQNNQIPASSEWIDRPYGTSGISGSSVSGWGNFDFDSSFPNPAQMISSLNAMGYNLMLWTANRCPSNTFLFTNGLASGFLWTNYLSTEPSADLLLPDADTWFKTNLNAFVNLGIRGYKIDRGEENVQPYTIQNTNQTAFQKLSWEGLAAAHLTDTNDNYGNFILSRCADDTARRYTAVWNGDSYCTFYSLQYCVGSGLCAGIINFPMWGSDTGGYISQPSAPSEELFARWFEFSAYSTMMEVLVGNHRTPWYNYSTNLVAIARAQASAHHDLIPYSRSCLYQATQTGWPVMCPLVFAFPNDAAVASTSDEYLYGPHILVAPVITAGASNRNVYLPAGNWLDYNTKAALFVGPTNLTTQAPTNTIPLLVREGAIIPRGDIWKGNNNWTPNWAPQLRLEFFPSDNFGTSFPYYTGTGVQNLTCTNLNHTLTIQFGNLGFPGLLQVYLRSPGAVLSNGITLLAGRDYTYGSTSNLLQLAFNGPTTLVVSNANSLFDPFAAWQTSWFGNITNLAVAGPLADPDGDGIPNFLEYAFGLNPLVASTDGIPLSKILADAGTNYLALTFRRALNASDITSTVQVSGDLYQWLAGSSYSGTNVISNTPNTTEVARVPSNGVETITVRDNVPVKAAPQRFMRLRVTN